MGYTLKIKLSQAHNGRLEKVFKHAYKLEFVERLEVKLKYNKTNKVKKVIKKLETQALK